MSLNKKDTSSTPELYSQVKIPVSGLRKSCIKFFWNGLWSSQLSHVDFMLLLRGWDDPDCSSTVLDPSGVLLASVRLIIVGGHEEGFGCLNLSPLIWGRHGWACFCSLVIGPPPVVRSCGRPWIKLLDTMCELSLVCGKLWWQLHVSRALVLALSWYFSKSTDLRWIVDRASFVEF